MSKGQSPLPTVTLLKGTSHHDTLAHTQTRRLSEAQNLLGWTRLLMVINVPYNRCFNGMRWLTFP